MAVDLEEPGALALARDLDRTGAPLRVPAAAWVEYFAGIEPQRREAVQGEVLRRAVFQGFGWWEAVEAVALWQRLQRVGQPLAWHAIQIAATALVLREPLVSNDKAFRHVPGLRVIAY